MFSILNELVSPTPLRTTTVVTASIGGAAAIYILVAITGYLSFGSNIIGNIVAQYTPSVASTIGRAAIVVLVMFSYPLQVHPCRASVDAVVKWRPTTSSSNNKKLDHRKTSNASPSRTSLLSNNNNNNNNNPSSSISAVSAPSPKPSPGEEISDLRFALITTAIILLSYTVAMTVSSLDKVLAYVGSTGSTSISFILPGLFYYKISAPDSPQHQRLLKDEEDEEYEEGGGGGGGESDVGPPAWKAAWNGAARGRAWRRGLLRKASLALAVYGLGVMGTCLVVNVFFASGSH